MLSLSLLLRRAQQGYPIDPHNFLLCSIDVIIINKLKACGNRFGLLAVQVIERLMITELGDQIDAKSPKVSRHPIDRVWSDCRLADFNGLGLGKPAAPPPSWQRLF